MRDLVRLLTSCCRPETQQLEFPERALPEQGAQVAESAASPRSATHSAGPAREDLELLTTVLEQVPFLTCVLDAAGTLLVFDSSASIQPSYSRATLDATQPIHWLPGPSPECSISTSCFRLSMDAQNPQQLPASRGASAQQLHTTSHHQSSAPPSWPRHTLTTRSHGLQATDQGCGCTATDLPSQPPTQPAVQCLGAPSQTPTLSQPCPTTFRSTSPPLRPSGPASFHQSPAAAPLPGASEQASSLVPGRQLLHVLGGDAGALSEALACAAQGLTWQAVLSPGSLGPSPLAPAGLPPSNHGLSPGSSTLGPTRPPSLHYAGLVNSNSMASANSSPQPPRDISISSSHAPALHRPSVMLRSSSCHAGYGQIGQLGPEVFFPRMELQSATSPRYGQHSPLKKVGDAVADQSLASPAGSVGALWDHPGGLPREQAGPILAQPVTASSSPSPARPGSGPAAGVGTLNRLMRAFASSAPSRPANTTTDRKFSSAQSLPLSYRHSLAQSDSCLNTSHSIATDLLLLPTDKPDVQVRAVPSRSQPSDGNAAYPETRVELGSGLTTAEGWQSPAEVSSRLYPGGELHDSWTDMTMMASTPVNAQYMLGGGAAPAAVVAVAISAEPGRHMPLHGSSPFHRQSRHHQRLRSHTKTSAMLSAIQASTETDSLRGLNISSSFSSGQRYPGPGLRQGSPHSPCFGSSIRPVSSLGTSLSTSLAQSTGFMEAARHLSYNKQNSGPLPEETPQLVDAARPAHASQDLGCTLLPRGNHSRTSQAGSLDMLHLRPPSSRQFHSRPPIPMAPRHATLPAPAPTAATSNLRSLGQQQWPSRTCSPSPSWSQQQHSRKVAQPTLRKSSHGGGGGREQGSGLGASPQAHLMPALPTHGTIAANGDAAVPEGGGGAVGMAGQGSWGPSTLFSAPKQEQHMLALPTTTGLPRSPVNKVTSVSAVLSKSLALLGSPSAVPERSSGAVLESNQKQAAWPEANTADLRPDCRTQPQMSEIVVGPQVHFESCPGRVRRGQDNKRAGTTPGTQPSPYLTALAAALPICQLGGAKSRLPVHAPVVPRNAVRPTPLPEVTAARLPCDLARALMYELGVTSVQITVKPMAMPSGRRLLLVVQEDVSETAAMEHMLADLAESQLTMASQIFPKHIIEYMATSGPSFGPEQVAGLARQHHHVTILFMDIVGFTSMSKEVPPEAVMAFLNTLFGHFDNLCDKHGVLKLETAGDCYIVAGGITSPTLHGDDGQGSTKGGAADEFNTVVDSHDVQLSAARVLAFAKDMLAVSRVVLMPHNQQPVVVRVGLHTGDCVSGLIGTKVPKFAVFGDSMNTASRMESTCAPMRIQASKPTASLLPEEPWEATGGIEVKGKGLMETFIWGGQLPDFSLASQPAQPAPWSAQNPHPLQGPTNLPSPSTTALSSGSLARLSGAARAPSQPRSSPADSLMHLSTSSLPPGNIAWATASNPVPGSGSLLPDPATIAAGTQSHDANVQRFHSLASWQLDSLISAPGSCHAEGDASARSRQPVNAEWNDATEIMLPFPTRGVADTAQRTTPNLSQASAAAAALRQWSVHQMVSLPPWQHPLLTIAESVMGSQDTGHDCSQDMAPRGCEPSMQRRSERQMGGDSNSRSPLAQSPAQPSYLSSNPVFNASPQHTHEATPCEVLGACAATKLRSIVEFDGEEASACSNNSHRSSAALATVSVPIPVTEARPSEVLATAVPTPTQRREPHPATASAPSPVAQRAVHGIAHIEVSEESGAQSAAKTTGDQGRPADSVTGSLASETGWAVGFGCNPADWAVEPQARGQQSLQEVRTRTTPAVSPRLSASPLLKAATASADQWLAAMSAASHDMYAERASQSSAIAGSRHSQDFMSCLSWATRKTEQAQGEASSSLSGLIGFLDEKSDMWRSAFPSPVVPQAGPASGDQEQRDPPSTLSLPAVTSSLVDDTSPTGPGLQPLNNNNMPSTVHSP